MPMTITNKREDYTHFIFTHIPKCGGTSFRKLLNTSAQESGVDKDVIYIPGQNKLPNEANIDRLTDVELRKLNSKNVRVWGGHHKFGELVGKRLITSKVFVPYYFTILRNPVERFISHYNFFHYKLGYHNCKEIHLNDLDKNDLLKFIKLYSNLQVRFISNIKRIKAVGLDNMTKIALYNLYFLYGSFAILEDMGNIITILNKTCPTWITFNSELSHSNQFSIDESINPDVIALIEKHNYYDMLLYEKAHNWSKQHFEIEN